MRSRAKERREIEDGLNLEGYAVLWGGGLDSGSVLGGLEAWSSSRSALCSKVAANPQGRDLSAMTLILAVVSLVVSKNL